MTQEQALDVLKTGANVFLTGAPGTGKTHVLNQYIRYLREHDVGVAITASTGIAATHIGGMTIHAWSGIGIKKELSDWDIDNLQTKQYLWKRYEKTHVLIIDEVSMIDAVTLETIDQLAKAFKRIQKPFGGMQIVVVGDFFQLPPVSYDHTDISFAFESHVWESANFLTCYLHNYYRQDDTVLIDILKDIRSGDLLESQWDILKSRSVSDIPEDTITHLYTHNRDVDLLNQSALNQLDTNEVFYTMKSKGSAHMVERLKKTCMSPETLILKKGALVMCTKNNFEAGYANGTIGTIIDFDQVDEYPIIQTRDEREIIVSPATWSIYDGESVVASIEQIPLRLAWAITIHKSQGMSLDAAYIDLSGVFEYGQGYVALSRVRSLAGLYIGAVNPQAFSVHPKVRSYDESFQRWSRTLSEYTAQKEQQSIKKCHQEFIINSGGSLQSKEDPAHISKLTTYEQTQKLLGQQLSIDEISRERDLTSGTILQHIEKLLDQQSVTVDEIQYLRPPKNDFERIASVFDDLHRISGSYALKPVRNELNNEYSFDDLRIVRLFIADIDEK